MRETMRQVLTDHIEVQAASPPTLRSKASARCGGVHDDANAPLSRPPKRLPIEGPLRDGARRISVELGHQPSRTASRESLDALDAVR